MNSKNILSILSKNQQELSRSNNDTLREQTENWQWKNKLIHQVAVVGYLYLIHLSDLPILEDELKDLLYLFSF